MSAAGRSPYAGLDGRLAGPARNPLGRMSRGGRRAVVVLAAACGLAAVVLPWLLDDAAQLLGAGPFFAVLLLNAALAVAARLGVDLPADLVDERVRARREHASWVALRLLQAPLLVAAVLVGVAARTGTLTISTAQAYSFTYGAFVVTAASTWVFAWNEPDAARSDDLELELPRVVEAPFPWPRVFLSVAFFGAATTALRLLGFGGPPPSVPAALVTGALSALAFGTLIALGLAWLRRRI